MKHIYLRVFIVLFCSLCLLVSVASGEDTDDEYARGVAAYRAGDYSKAAGYFEVVVKKDSGDATVFYNLGLSYLYLGDNFSAEEKLNNALLVNAEMPEAYYALGSLYLKLKRGVLARANYKKACELGFSRGCLVYKNL